MIGKYIYSRLTANATFTALVGTKVYPIAAPQETAPPFAVYSVSITPATFHKGGAATKDNYSVTLRIFYPPGQTTDAYDKVNDCDEAIRDVLDESNTTAGGITVEGSAYTSSTDGMDETTNFFYREVNYNFRMVRP